MFFSSISLFYGIRSLIPAILYCLDYYTYASQDSVETPALLLFLPLLPLPGRASLGRCWSWGM